MGEAVELGAHLPDLRDNQLLVAPRRFEKSFMNVRLTVTLYVRAGLIGILSFSTCAISMTSPVLMSCVARSTLAGFM